MNMTEGSPLALLSVFALPLLLLHLTSAGIWSIWITAGVTWLLAGTTCLLRYISWGKKETGTTRDPELHETASSCITETDEHRLKRRRLTEENDDQNTVAAQP